MVDNKNKNKIKLSREVSIPVHKGLDSNLQVGGLDPSLALEQELQMQTIC